MLIQSEQVLSNIIKSMSYYCYFFIKILGLDFFLILFFNTLLKALEDNVGVIFINRSEVIITFAFILL